MITVFKQLSNLSGTFGTALFIGALFAEGGINTLYLMLGSYAIFLSIALIIISACLED